MILHSLYLHFEIFIWKKKQKIEFWFFSFSSKQYKKTIIIFSKFIHKLVSYSVIALCCDLTNDCRTLLDLVLVTIEERDSTDFDFPIASEGFALNYYFFRPAKLLVILWKACWLPLRYRAKLWEKFGRFNATIF